MPFVERLMREPQPKSESEPRPEDRLLSIEKKFAQRVVEGMPFSAPPPRAAAAQRVVVQMVARAFQRWFVPQRAAVIEAWAPHGASFDPSIEESYGMFLEKVALRRGKHVPIEADRWGTGEDHLDEVLDVGAELFRCAMQQQEGWISQYGELSHSEEHGRKRQQEYLYVVNLARGFLGVRQLAPHERQELLHVGLQSKGGSIFPDTPALGHAHHQSMDESESAFEIGKHYREAYEAEVRRCLLEDEERRAFAKVVDEAIQVFGRDALIGPPLIERVRRSAWLVIELERRLQELCSTQKDGRRKEIEMEEDPVFIDARLRHARAVEAMGRARVLLQIFETAKQLSLIDVEDAHEVILLGDIAYRLST